MGDYAMDPTPMQNFNKIPLPPFAPKYAKMRHEWFFLQLTAKTPAPICTINTSNDVVSRKDVPFGGAENKILHFDPHFPQKAQIFGHYRRALENFASKRPQQWGCLGVNYL